MSVELNCAQGGQSSLLCKRSIELVELPRGNGGGNQAGGVRSPACPEDPTGPEKEWRFGKLEHSDLEESELCPNSMALAKSGHPRASMASAVQRR